MPKQVDHDERRREIAAAVLRLVTTRGVEAASLRTVASEARVSMGAVQHYFTTKDEMLQFALAYGNTLLAERATRLMAEQKPATPRQAFRLLCTLLLPLDEDGRAGARLWAGLISRGCVDEPTQKLAALAYTNLTDFVVRQLSDALPDANAAQAARHLVSVIEGLRWPVLFGVYTEQQAMDIVDTQLDLIF
ncbi:MAG: TetR/AcrR family transcriptional regulator [Nocardiopsaceae bacterium]|jgi:AcrR family transcriptional regulator|nr:TetR/AcrR family transcriptional regulator [Nocardiopsaceae bacterium]